MTKLFKIFLYIMAIFAGMVSYAQQNTEGVEFLYDNAGNRVLRHVITIITNVKETPVDSINTENKNNGRETTRLQQEMNQFWENVIKIYPNPNEGLFTVKINRIAEVGKGKLYLFSPKGKLVYTKEPLERSMRVNISTFPVGTYLLTVLIDDKKKTWKVIKR